MFALEHFFHVNTDNGISGINKKNKEKEKKKNRVWQVNGVFKIWSQHKSIL